MKEGFPPLMMGSTRMSDKSGSIVQLKTSTVAVAKATPSLRAGGRRTPPSTSNVHGRSSNLAKGERNKTTESNQAPATGNEGIAENRPVEQPK